jgi:hypothetical protein
MQAMGNLGCYRAHLNFGKLMKLAQLMGVEYLPILRYCAFGIQPK